MVRPTVKQENEFTKTFLVFDGESNVKGDFATISKKSGVAYFEYLRAAWACSDGMSEEEFCRINGGVPAKIFNEKVKNSGIEYEVSEVVY